MVKIIKNLTEWGGSKGIVIPDFWLESLELTHGVQPKKVELDVQDNKITITPILDEEEVDK